MISIGEDDMKWETTQSKVNGLNLNDLINEEFLNKLKNEFENKDIDIVTIQLSVRDKINDFSQENNNLDIISLANKSVEDTLINNVIVDVNFEENFNKIKNVLNELNED